MNMRMLRRSPGCQAGPILAVFASALGLGSAYGQNGSVGVAHPAGVITVDGDLRDWPVGLKDYPIGRIEFGDRPGGDGDLKAHFRAAYNPAERALYVAVEVRDDSVVLDGPGELKWDAQDGCDLYVDAAHLEGGSSVIQYARYGDRDRTFGPGETLEKAMKVAVKRADSRVVYEWRIEIGEIQADRVIGFDVSVADKDKDGSFTWAAWGPGTQKVDVADRCGELLLVEAGTKFGEVAGRLEWVDPSAGPLPPRVQVRSSRHPRFWRGAVVDGTGAFKASDLPAGPYSIHPLDSSDVRVDSAARVDVRIEADRIARADTLRVRPIPWPGLIGDEGILRSPGAIDDAQIDRFAKAYLDYFKIPGMSLAVIKDSKVVYHRGLGVRNQATGEPVTANTVFEAASMTKPMFAYVVMRLVDRGVLKLDTPLYTYLPYEDISHDERYKLITARMVLTHRTGFPNWREGKLDIKFVPGTQFSYSGEGFVYLGKVVEKLTGKKLVDLFREEAFTPLGIENASLVWDDRVALTVATGHDHTKPLQKWRVAEPNTAASLHIDAGNYAKFLIGVLQGKGLSEASSREMLRPQGEIPDDPKRSFGLGISVERTPLGLAYGHGGRNTGFTSNSTMLKDKGLGFVVLVNNDDERKIGNALLAYLIAGKSALDIAKPVTHKLAKVDPKIYDAYLGTYRISFETFLTITRDGDRLMAQPRGEGKFELFPESETVFFLKPTEDTTFTFVKDDRGKVNEFLFRRGSNATKATRIDEEGGAKQPDAAPAAGKPLKAGMLAPEFRVERFLKGSPFTSLEKGRIHVLDFWATGCGPCVVSMPHLSQLQREYRDKGVTICGVNIWEDSEYSEATLKKVSEFLRDYKDQLDFTIAYDGAAKFMDNAWMKAAERNGIPCTFVVNREGTVAWIGHPDMLDMVLDEVVRGTWDIAAGPERLKQAEAAFDDAATKYKESLPAGDASWGEAMARYPKLGRTRTGQRLGALLRGGHFAAAHDLGSRLIAEARKAHAIEPVRTVLEALESPNVLGNDSAKALLVEAARANFDLTDTVAFAPYARHAVMARAYFRAGRNQEAQASVSKALELAPEAVRSSIEKWMKEVEQESKQK